MVYFKRLVDYVKKLPLNNHIFFIFLSLMLVASVGSIIGNLLTNYPWIANLKWLLSIALCVCGFILIYINKFLETFKVFLFAIALGLIIFPSWYYGWADNLITLLYLILVLIEVFFVLDKLYLKIFFAIVCVLMGVAFMVITYIYPGLIQGDQGQNVLVDSIVQIVIIFLIATSVGIFTNNFEKQHNLLISLNEKLEKLAITDDLSEVYNKRKIVDILENSCNDKSIETVFVAMIDIDSFKIANDTYGHIVGDQVIRFVAQHLTGVVGDLGSVGRYGGDEFLLVLTKLSDCDMEAFSSKLIDVGAFEDKLNITISCGMRKRDLNETSGSLIHNADKLLLLAKANEKNNIQFSEKN